MEEKNFSHYIFLYSLRFKSISWKDLPFRWNEKLQI